MKLNIIPNEVNMLLIEDDGAASEVICKQLNSTRHIKFNITIRSTLKEGLEYLDDKCALKDTCNIDVILLDLVLPNSHGVATFLKVQKNTLNIPIVIISAHEDIACKCVGLGAQDYLVKPDISSALLIRSITYAIQRNDIEKKMRNVIMTSSLGYHMYELQDDGELYFVGYNPASNKILNIDHNQFLGKKLQDVFPNLTDELYEGYFGAVRGTPWINQIVSYKDDNITKADFKINAYKTFNNQLTVTFEDITNQLQIEKKLHNTLAEYKNLIEVTGASIYGIDFINNKFSYVNDVICNQLGYTREELLKIAPLDILTQESLQVWIDRFNALKNGEFIDDNVEYEAIKKDGSTMWFLLTAEYVEDDDKNVIGANVVAIDITARKVAEDIIKQKDQDAFYALKGKIQIWKEEIIVQDIERRENLELIDAEILSLNVPNVEVLQ